MAGEADSGISLVENAESNQDFQSSGHHISPLAHLGVQCGERIVDGAVCISACARQFQPSQALG